MEKLPTSMLKVPAGEFQRNIGRYQDMALTQPIAITRNGHERTVLISALETTRTPESSKAFDHELQQ